MPCGKANLHQPVKSDSARWQGVGREPEPREIHDVCGLRVAIKVGEVDFLVLAVPKLADAKGHIGCQKNERRTFEVSKPPKSDLIHTGDPLHASRERVEGQKVFRQPADQNVAASVGDNVIPAHQPD